jgi:lysophospholipase-3
VECLDDSDVICDTITEVQYLKDFVKYFTNRGYQRQFNLRAAPYDWRLAADSHARQGYFDNLRTLAETMYNETGKPVAMVVHSMGGPMSLYFLNEVVTQEWKNKYIKVYIPLSGAWAGASEPLEAVVSGYFPLTFCPLTSYLKDIERSIQSLYWLTPRAEVFRSQVLMQTPNTNYTANDYQQLFTNFANYPLGWTKYMPTSSINAGYSYPQVPTYCFYGSNIETPLTYVYSSDVASSNPSVINGLGDGTVNEISLEVCLNWNASTNSSGFQSRAFPGVEHVDMVKNGGVLQAVCRIVDPQSDCPDSATTVGRISILSLVAIAFMSVIVV